MKKLLIGIIIGFLAFPFLNDVFMTLSDFNPENKILDKITSKMIYPQYGINHVLTKRCTKDVSKNGHGWVFIKRDYFKCNKLQIMASDLIFGERTKPRDLELEKQACKKCNI